VRKTVAVNVWLIVAAVVVGAFLVYKGYLKPCQPTFLGPCNTGYHAGCCPGTNMVCYNQRCIKLHADTKTYEDN
jgi:hypothetical protein